MNDQDLANVGLSEEAHLFLVTQKKLGNIKHLIDAYKLGIAYAIRLGEEPPEIPTSNRAKANMYDAGSIDDVVQIIVALGIVPEDTTPARYAERLADHGIRKIKKITATSGLRFNKISESLEQEIPKP